MGRAINNLIYVGASHGIVFDGQSIKHVSITELEEVDRDAIRLWRKFNRLKKWWKNLHKPFEYVEVGDKIYYSGEIVTVVNVHYYSIVCLFKNGFRVQDAPLKCILTPECIGKKQNKRVIEACFGHTELASMGWPKEYDKTGSLVWCDWIEEGQWGPVWQAKAEMLRVIIENHLAYDTPSHMGIVKS